MNGLMKRFTLLAATIAAGALLLSGCSGDDGSNGNNALETQGVVSAKTFTADDLKNNALEGVILSASIPGNQPVVKFQVINKQTRKGITGLRTFSLHIAQLKPELAGGNSYWLNYISDGLPLSAIPAFRERNATTETAPKNPATDAVSVYNTDGTLKAQGYSVVDHGDGTYTVTFGANIKANTNVPFDASLVHRIAITVRSVVVPGVVGVTDGAYAGPIDPATGSVFASFTNTNGAAFVYDFVPATGVQYTNATGGHFARDIVTIAACNQCHYKLEYGSNNTSGHFGSRPDTKICVMCHTPQLGKEGETAGKFNDGDSGNFTSFIHQIHMGEELPIAATPVDYDVSEFKYPQDVRNCIFCHKGADVNNWTTKPSRRSCGSCHNNIDFATGVNSNTAFGSGEDHAAQADDSLCQGCHLAGPNSAATAHITNDSTPNNASVPEGYVKFTYAVTSATITSNQPVITFTIKKDGTNVAFDTAGSNKLRRLPLGLQGFKGGPTLRVFFAVTQDKITSPADFNASISVSLQNLWRGLGGTLVQNADGSYTATITGTVSSSNVVTSASVPASAKMVTALIYGNYTQAVPFATYSTGNESTTAIPGVARNTLQASKVATGSTARRAIVTNAKCNACHEQLGIFPSFHSGGRNDGATCNLCHIPNQASAGWSADSNTFVHAIHGAGKRSVAFNWHSSSSIKYWTVGYPGVLKNCEQCHVAGSYDFSTTTNAAAVANMPYRTTAYGAAIVASPKSPYVTAGTNYGNSFSYNVNTGVTTQAAAATLVSSPISAACFSCHDTSAATAHMRANGGVLYARRDAAFTSYSTADGRVNSSTAPATVEQCLVCHGALSSTNVSNTTTPAIKAVHRWW